MFKFLRKHSTWILAIFGTLLMVVFLIPQAIQSLSKRAATGGSTWATVGVADEKVSARDFQLCQSELQMLQRLQQPVPGFGLMDNPAHWYLLVREADSAGLVGGQMTAQMPLEQRARLMELVGRSDRRFVDQTLAKILGVSRMIGMYQSAAKLSDNRLRALARRQFHSVQSDLVVIEAKARDDLPEPSEEEILAQYKAFRDIAPGEGEKGFGYRLPNRAKLEWLLILTDSIREMVQASDDLNGVALLKHWRRNPNGKPFPAYQRGQSIPDIVRQDLLNTLVASKRDEIRKFASDAFLETQRRLEMVDGYLELPEGWDQRKVDYRALAEQLQAEFPGLPLPIYEAIGDRWLDDLELRRIPIAMSWTEQYGSRLGPAQLIALTREFGGDPVVLIQEDVTAPVLKTSDESILFFRITDTDPARPPHDLAEVREQVVSDLKRKADYERLRREVQAIDALAKSEGLLSVALEYETPILPNNPVHIDNPYRVALQLQAGMPLEPMPSSLPIIKQYLPAIEIIIDRALQFPVDQPLSEIPAEQRTLVIPADDKMTILVVELVQQYPLDEQRFTDFVTTRLLQRLLLNEELDAAQGSVEEAFGFETMVKRHNFKVKQRRASEDEEGEEAAPGDETTDEATAAAGSAG